MIPIAWQPLSSSRSKPAGPRSNPERPPSRKQPALPVRSPHSSIKQLVPCASVWGAAVLCRCHWVGRSLDRQPKYSSCKYDSGESPTRCATSNPPNPPPFLMIEFAGRSENGHISIKSEGSPRDWPFDQL